MSELAHLWTPERAARRRQQQDEALAAGLCAYCRKQPHREGRKSCQGCADALAAKRAEPAERAKNRARSRAWQEANPERKAEKNRQYRERLWQAVLDAYGRACSCCGEAEEAFLTVDHIDGSGAEHRREIRARGSDFYRWLRRAGYPADYRLLCWNCNCALGIRGACPHDARREVAV